MADSYHTTIHADWQRVWALLVDKIERPDRYIPGITSVEILDKDDDFVLRRMQLGDMTIEEVITWDESSGEVVFTLNDHPALEGHVINRLEETDDGALVLTFIADQRPRDPGGEIPDMRQPMREAVEHTKALAEAQAKQQPEANP